LSGVINLRPEEQKSFRSLFLLSLITGIGLSYYFVAVNSFLIQKASVSNLPYAYIISGLGGVLLIKIYQYRQQKKGIITSYRESVIAFFLVAAIVFIAFRRLGEHEDYAVYIAYLGFLFNMPFTIIFALSFSGIWKTFPNSGSIYTFPAFRLPNAQVMFVGSGPSNTCTFVLKKCINKNSFR
jgi:hypothetical protein